jgi:hypothetical protein
VKVILAAIVVLLISGCKKEYTKIKPAEPENDSLKIVVYGERISLSSNVTTGPAISGVTVKLYQSALDMYNKQNQVGTAQITGTDGSVTFTNLKPIVYFYYAEKGCENNMVANPQPGLGNSTGYELVGGDLNLSYTLVRSGGNIRIINKTGFTVSVVLQSEFWVDDHGPRYTFTLSNNQSKYYTAQPTGYYFVTASRDGAPNLNTSIVLVVCGDEISYELK